MVLSRVSCRKKTGNVLNLTDSYSTSLKIVLGLYCASQACSLGSRPGLRVSFKTAFTDYIGL